MSTLFHLSLPASIHAEIISQAQAELPNECCGILAGKIDTTRAVVTMRFQLVNALASPVEFLADDRSMFDAVRAMDRAGLDMVAVYHSHPTSAPLPSKKDRERNYWEVLAVIVSLESADAELRCWRLQGMDFTEIPVQLT